MARIALDPPRTLSYRIDRWCIRRQFGAWLAPFRAHRHNIPVAQAFGKLEQSAARWKKLDLRSGERANLTAAVMSARSLILRSSFFQRAALCSNLPNACATGML